MKLLSVLLVAALSFGNAETSMFSCGNDDPNDPKGQVVVGGPVGELSHNLMRVFQDSKGHYWFGTWGEGLYRYDGKTVIRFTTSHGFSNDRSIFFGHSLSIRWSGVA